MILMALQESAALNARRRRAAANVVRNCPRNSRLTADGRKIRIAGPNNLA